jgi:hypothetical protein
MIIFLLSLRFYIQMCFYRSLIFMFSQNQPSILKCPRKAYVKRVRVGMLLEVVLCLNNCKVFDIPN